MEFVFWILYAVFDFLTVDKIVVMLLKFVVRKIRPGFNLRDVEIRSDFSNKATIKTFPYRVYLT